jgi:hypothetical protein
VPKLRRASGHLVVLLASSLLFASPATATPLPPSANPLPGSLFQGADGNQADAPPRIDWQAMQAAGRAYHNPDPNPSDTAFTGGSKENEPGNWAFRVEPAGVDPRKDNILDAWSAADQGGAEAFLYLAFVRQGTAPTREGSAGTTFLTFELNHDARLWNNGNAMIPCRRTGDILVSYEAHGNDVNVVIQRWITSTLPNATDPLTGCARRGRLDDYTRFTPNADAQGAINNAGINSFLPGFYEDTVPLHRFGEAALNLSRILEEGFADTCFSFGSIWMHSRSSTEESSNLQDYVAPETLAVRTCAASGTKFHDLNANGRLDSGEPGLPRYLIWADYDDDGVRDVGPPAEPFAITDNEGQYVINDIRPPDGTYMLRETLLTTRARRRAAAADITCSYPNSSTDGGTGSAPGGQFPCGWGPIAVATTTNARGRDFGNYEPAELVVEKELAPPSDPGRFNLLVDGVTVAPAAGDGAIRTLSLRPGLHTVSEVPAAGTNAANYDSTVECKRGARRRQLRSGPVYANLMLNSGDRAVCTFRNLRPGAAAIAIDKTGPATAQAGDTLSYTLYVTNPGDVPFPAASVRVTDAACDDPPELVDKVGDGSPGTLDPGDTWTYRCSRKTAAAGADCRPSVVPNSATATGTVGGTSVSDTSSIETALSCPPAPGPQPPGPQPPPSPPSPVVPPGPSPPNAGDAGRAAFARVVRGCIRGRVSRVNFQGTRIASIRIFVNGQLRRSLTVAPLRRRVTRRVRLAPGRYRVSARVRFERGSGSPPVTLSQVVRVCAARRAQPPFTG